jgi:hypothetical protein
LARITFLGEQQDITDPEGAVLVASRRRNANVLVRQQPVDDLSGHAHQVTLSAVSYFWVDGNALQPSDYET